MGHNRMPVVSTAPPSTVDMAPVVAPDACTMEGSGVGVGKGTDGEDNVDEDEIQVCDAFLCCYDGILWKDCLGCSAKQEGICCALGLGICSWGLRMPRSCCMCQEQMCCCVSSAAFPCTAEVPMMCAYCCLMCYPKVGCVVKKGEAVGKHGCDDSKDKA